MIRLILTGLIPCLFVPSLNAGFVYTLTELNNIDGTNALTHGNGAVPDLEAVLEFSVMSADTNWTVSLSNNSELFQNANGSPTKPKYSSPGVVGFGFSTIPDVMVQSWRLEAFTIDNGALSATPVVIGSSDANLIDSSFASQGSWTLNPVMMVNGNYVFDYTPNASDGMHGALYNPDHFDEISSGTASSGGDPWGFTNATLFITFSAATALDTSAGVAVKFQNVGEDGGKSAKLVSSVFEEVIPPPDDAPGIVPEPSSILLFGLGAIGMIGYGYRRRKTAMSA